MAKRFDVIVIGGGHAGAEAATASARLGAKTALINYNFETLGEMSCNPSIGGVGKGIIVREVDAMDGVMGRAIDEGGIHFKMLNMSKGPAVWGPRAQADRVLYKKAMQNILSSYPNLTLIFGEVEDLLIEDDISGILDDSEARARRVIGVVAGGNVIKARSIVLTTGTFLNGLIHIGNKKIYGGRFNEKASSLLANKIRDTGMRFGRLKTGTPPRLDANTIDFTLVERQKADDSPLPFSFMTPAISQKQIDCYITYTNKVSHQIILNNAHLSPLYTGVFTSAGPRYCPSIEDKLKRFADKERHQIFLEPEGIDSEIVYPNGLSTSMPEEIQQKFINSIKGLEKTKIVRFGYAIEYDYVDPTELKATLESKKINGLFLAGQINGTTGYEEAAGQGIIAGINAALSIDNKEFVLRRSDSYIGVMIDDLITKGVKEPYRMMTSRAEYRIFLRSDNADMRLTEKCLTVGSLISDERRENFSKMKNEFENLKRSLSEYKITYGNMSKAGFYDILQDGQVKSTYELLSNPKVTLDILSIFIPSINNMNSGTLERVRIDSLYANYSKRYYNEIQVLQKESVALLPEDIDYTKIPGLSNEVRVKLAQYKPSSIAEMKVIQGITPTALITLKLYLKKHYGLNI